MTHLLHRSIHTPPRRAGQRIAREFLSRMTKGQTLYRRLWWGGLCPVWRHAHSPKLIAALHAQLDKLAYAHYWGFSTTDVGGRVGRSSDRGRAEGLSHVYLLSGGSEASWKPR